MSDLARVYGLTVRSEVPLHAAAHRARRDARRPRDRPRGRGGTVGGDAAGKGAARPAREPALLRRHRGRPRLPSPVLRVLRRRPRPDPDAGHGAPDVRRRPGPAARARQREPAGVRAHHAGRNRPARECGSGRRRGTGVRRGLRHGEVHDGDAAVRRRRPARHRRRAPSRHDERRTHLRPGSDRATPPTAAPIDLAEPVRELPRGSARPAMPARRWPPLPATTEDLPLAALVVPVPDHSPRPPCHRDHRAVAEGGDGGPLPVPSTPRMAGRRGPPRELPPARGRRRPGAGSRRSCCRGVRRSRRTSPRTCSGRPG